MVTTPVVDTVMVPLIVQVTGSTEGGGTTAVTVIGTFFVAVVKWTRSLGVKSTVRRLEPTGSTVPTGGV